MSRTHLWMRAETRPTEQRAPIAPDDAAGLIARGHRVSVEESAHRVFPVADYARAGCEIVPQGSWPDAPGDAVVVGIKELPARPDALVHRHVYFAHAYKGQEGADELLARFRRGRGELLDIEYLTQNGRRVVAFGYWAGFVGAALGVQALRGTLGAPVAPGDREQMDRALTATSDAFRALVIGARGRSGQGALAALRLAGAQVTGWDSDDTEPLDRQALLGHDLLVNCIVSTAPARPQDQFVRPSDLATPGRRLRTIADVTCDVTGPTNRLPVNTAVTTWDEPVRTVTAGGGSVDVIAIDNLPSLLPREASIGFSADLAPWFDQFGAGTGPWAAAAEEFRIHVRERPS